MLLSGLTGPRKSLETTFFPKKVLWRDFRAILSAKCVNKGYHITQSKPIRVRGVGDMGVGPGWGCGSGQVGPSRAGAGGWGRVTVGRRVADSRSTAEAYVRRRRLKNLTLLYPIILSLTLTTQWPYWPRKSLETTFFPQKRLWRDFRAILSAKCVDMGYLATQWTYWAPKVP